MAAHLDFSVDSCSRNMTFPSSRRFGAPSPELSADDDFHHEIKGFPEGHPAGGASRADAGGRSKPPVLSVWQLNQQVSDILESGLPQQWVGGEVSNFTRAASGHWYFTLKDARASVRAVMFRGRAQAVGFEPRQGDKIEVLARVTVYAPRGEYQLQVDGMRRAGLGDLYEAFLRLKEKLAAQGLLDAARKRPIPVLPRAIGVVTSLQAAALRDVLSALARRAPNVPVILYPAPVQGDEAAARLREAVLTAGRRAETDVLLVVRGGGSIESLWSFNDEGLALAIAASPMPVISGVGHETDFTIADFVADLRAPTPTAAAELACVPRADWLGRLETLARGLVRAQRRRLEQWGQRLDYAQARLVSPAQQWAQRRERLQARIASMQVSVTHLLARRGSQLALLQARLAHAAPDGERQGQRLAQLRRDLAARARYAQERRQRRLENLLARLQTLNPEDTLARGYAIAWDAEGHVVSQAANLAAGQTLTLQLARGSSQVEVLPSGKSRKTGKSDQTKSDRTKTGGLAEKTDRADGADRADRASQGGTARGAAAAKAARATAAKAGGSVSGAQDKRPDADDDTQGSLPW